jgi:RNA polymerase sigma-B factor
LTNPSDDERAAAHDADELLRAYAISREPALLDQLVVLHLDLVSRLARRQASRVEQLDDLIQVGYIGLIIAIDRFEPERGTQFVTYAVPTIDGEIRRYLRDKGSIVRIPRHLQEMRAAVDRATEQLTQQLGRRPTTEEVAADLNVAPQQVAVVQGDVLASPVSLDRVGDDGNGAALPDAIGREQEEMRRFEGRLLIERAFQRLTPRQRAIVYLLFYEDLSQAEIGGS